MTFIRGLDSKEQGNDKKSAYGSFLPQESFHLMMENLTWRLDFLSIPTIIRKRGASLYLLLPASVVRALSLKDEQKAKITILTAEKGTRIGLFVDLGTPKLVTNFYELEFEVEPPNAGRALIDKIANMLPAHFISLESKNGKANCVIKFASRDIFYFLETRNAILKVAKKLGAKVVSFNAKHEEASIIPLDSSLIKEVIREVEGYELIWE